jgi:hypothetical protein
VLSISSLVGSAITTTVLHIVILDWRKSVCGGADTFEDTPDAGAAFDSRAIHDGRAFQKGNETRILDWGSVRWGYRPPITFAGWGFGVGAALPRGWEGKRVDEGLDTFRECIGLRGIVRLPWKGIARRFI